MQLLIKLLLNEFILKYVLYKQLIQKQKFYFLIKIILQE